MCVKYGQKIRLRYARDAFISHTVVIIAGSSMRRRSCNGIGKAPRRKAKSRHDIPGSERPEGQRPDTWQEERKGHYLLIDAKRQEDNEIRYRIFLPGVRRYFRKPKTGLECQRHRCKDVSGSFILMTSRAILFSSFVQN